MVTKEQALTESRFHTAHPTKPGACSVWRRNGKTQTWKTRPNEFRIPVKFGLYSYDQITHINCDVVHVESECPNAQA